MSCNNDKKEPNTIQNIREKVAGEYSGNFEYVRFYQKVEDSTLKSYYDSFIVTKSLFVSINDDTTISFNFEDSVFTQDCKLNLELDAFDFYHSSASFISKYTISGGVLNHEYKSWHRMGYS